MSDDDSSRETQAKSGPRPSRPTSGAETGAKSPATVTAVTSETIDPIPEEFWQVSFGISKNLRYHQQRRAWFDLWHRLGLFGATLAGTGTFAIVAGANPAIAQYFAIGGAIFAALDMAVNFSASARLHHELHIRFSELAAQMVSVERPSVADIARWRAERLRIEADEPPELAALNILCHNEEARARGYGEDCIYRVSFLNRMFKHLYSFPDEFPPVVPPTPAR